MAYFGYRYRVDGKHYPAVRLENLFAVERFIRENLEEPQIIISDEQDRQLLLIRDGVDLFNELDRIGISLSALLAHIREEAVQGKVPPQKKPEWERLYDQIGLSPGEIRMRQRVKADCRAAQTVQDVAELVRGTYFDAHFYNPDQSTWYRYFDDKTYEASVMVRESSGEWIDTPERRVLSPDRRVRHLRSSEDIHTFEIMD